MLLQKHALTLCAKPCLSRLILGLLAANLLAANISVSQAAPLGNLWSNGYGNDQEQRFYDFDTDQYGNIVVTGYFKEDLSVGGATLTSTTNTILLAKYSFTGGHLWSFGFSSSGSEPGDEAGRSVAVDAAGNVIMVCYAAGPIDVGGGVLPHLGSNEIIIAKFDPNGNHLWSNSYGNTGSDAATDVVVDGAGNIIVTGLFSVSVDFGGGPIVSNGSWDVFVAKYTTNSIHVWSQGFGGSGGEYGHAVAVNGAGNVFISGTFYDTINFGGTTFTSNGLADGFSASFDATGSHRWSKSFGGTGNDGYLAIEADPSGDIVISGYFLGSIDFGCGAITSAGDADGVVVRYADDGSCRWSLPVGGLGSDVAYGARLTPAGNVDVVGFYSGDTDLGTGLLLGAGSSDLLITKYSSFPSEPVIETVLDIAGDQGGNIRLRFDRSAQDSPLSLNPIVRYHAFRRDENAVAKQSLPSDAAALGWTEIASVSAFGEDSYGINVGTVTDSTVAAGLYQSVYYVRAATSLPWEFFDSAPDSGYSLDNIAPAAPTSVKLAGSVLSWVAPVVSDLAYFSVYGSNGGSFGSATLIDYSTIALLDVAASPYSTYFVTATDVAGNEGNEGTLATASGVDGLPSQYILSVSNYPNPFNPRTSIRFTVPSSGPVSVVIFDLAGNRVATLVDGEQYDAGGYQAEWSGHDDQGSGVSSGIYFARITHAGVDRVRKLTLQK